MKTFIAVLSLSFALTGIASAQDAVPAKPTEKKICRSPEVPTGSMLPGKRTCHTKSEWAQIDDANHADADRARGNRGQAAAVAR